MCGKFHWLRRKTQVSGAGLNLSGASLRSRKVSPTALFNNVELSPVPDSNSVEMKMAPKQRSSTSDSV